MFCRPTAFALSLIAVVALGATAHTQDATLPGADAPQGASAEDLANPVASLISVPFQNNFDFGGGVNDDAFRDTLNIQPVIPISLNEDWNLHARYDGAERSIERSPGGQNLERGDHHLVSAMQSRSGQWSALMLVPTVGALGQDLRCLRASSSASTSPKTPS